MSDPGFWSNQEKAQATLAEVKSLRNWLDPYEKLSGRVDSAIELDELLQDATEPEMEKELDAEISRLHDDIDSFEVRSLLRGPDDFRDAQLEISAGAGGTEAQDWAQMLMRMYIRWAERRGFEVSVLDESEGEEAGIKGAVLEIRGLYAFGFLRPETGVHRLVRISPFDANARRHTSFASVFVYPVVNEEINIEIRDEDLRIDVYRASGAGGQHVNKTSSAIRITHLPTGVVVTCQDERSQLQNRAKAMDKLKAILAARAEEEREAELQKIAGGRQAQVGWGSQIRSYVFQPYQMVKDLRTEHESGNVMGVLDGDLDGFMEAYLRWKRAGPSE